MPRFDGLSKPAHPSGFDDLNSQSERESRVEDIAPRIRDLADPLKWIGFSFFGIYLATLIAVALPVKLLDPRWISRICGSILGGVSFPLVAMGMILISAYLQRSSKEPQMVTDLRRLCSLVAVGFLLLIPLQSWAGQKLIDLAVQNQQASIQPSERALKAVYAATNEEELLEAIRLIPGAPPNIGARLEEPVQIVRERLISEIEPQVRQQQNQVKGVVGEIRGDSQIKLFKDGIVALFSALAFAAIGRSKPYKQTILQKFFGPPGISSAGMNEMARLADEYEQT